MKYYTAPLAIDKDGTPMHSAPAPQKALVTTVSENAGTSSVITVSQDATKIEIVTQGTAALMRWVPTGDGEGSVFGNASIMNYDHAIPANSLRTFVIPIEAQPATGYSSQMGANRLNGLYRRFAWRTQGVASVYSTQYP